jgi:hypothetical protein
MNKREAAFYSSFTLAAFIIAFHMDALRVRVLNSERVKIG